MSRYVDGIPLTPDGFTILAHEDPELERAWKELERWSVYTHGGAKPKSDCGCAFPHRCAMTPGGESWQYMGTQGLFHEFRHRDWPLLGRRVVVKVPRSNTVGVTLTVRYC